MNTPAQLNPVSNEREGGGVDQKETNQEMKKQIDSCCKGIEILLHAMEWSIREARDLKCSSRIIWALQRWHMQATRRLDCVVVSGCVVTGRKNWYDRGNSIIFSFHLRTVHSSTAMNRLPYYTLRTTCFVLCSIVLQIRFNFNS